MGVETYREVDLQGDESGAVVGITRYPLEIVDALKQYNQAQFQAVETYKEAEKAWVKAQRLECKIVYVVKEMLYLVDMRGWNMRCCWHLCEKSEKLGFNPFYFSKTKWLEYLDATRLYVASPTYGYQTLTLGATRTLEVGFKNSTIGLVEGHTSTTLGTTDGPRDDLSLN
ncbi:hypothetical protein V6N13_124043 [Hibiscus sabdariffa]